MKKEKTIEELVDIAWSIILEEEVADAIMLHRKMKIGYAKSAMILDILEEKGFIGEATDNPKNRKINRYKSYHLSNA